MKLLSILLLLILFPSKAFSDSLRTQEIEYVIQKLRPSIAKKLKKEVAFELDKLTSQSKIDWKRYISILFQESSLQLNPKAAGKLYDYGIGQVSYYYWGKKLKIDKKKSLNNTKYSISISIIVYLHYRKKYAKRDSKWYTRYHSGTPSKRKAYEKRIDAHYGKIVVAQEQFRRTLLHGQNRIVKIQNQIQK